MNIEILLSALMLGLIGSFHCAGMCGPIALAIPLNNKNWFSKINGSLIYNIGRAITYAAMGAVFGLFGKGLVLAGFQKWVSIIMGLIMVTSVLFPSLYKNNINLGRKASSFVGKLKIKLSALLQKPSYGSLLLIGLLNGLLPCGLVYMAIAGAIATTNSLSGALFMFIFGLGTLPMLFAISILSNTLGVKLRTKMTKIIPVVVFFIGVLFILRGLGLGIPFLSPPEKKLHVPETMEMNMNMK